MAWADHVALLVPNVETAAAANFTALKTAYETASTSKAPLYIPPGTYHVRLDPIYDGGGPSGNGFVILLGVSPVIGAGSSITILKFHYPEGRAAPTLTKGENSCVFSLIGTTHTDSAARIEGLTLEMADPLRGDGAEPVPPDVEEGSVSPKCWAVRVFNSAVLRMIDVRTTGWHTAIEAYSQWAGLGIHLERCYIASRGVRISVSGPSSLTMLDCTIDQDVPGFTGFYIGVLFGRSTDLQVIGGQSLRNPEGAYGFHTDANGYDSTPSTQLTIRDHYFGPNSRIAAEFTARYGAVQIDNCTFEGRAGIYISSSACTHLISNCVFNVLQAAISDGEKAGNDAEAYLTNCRFSSAAGRAVISRRVESASKPWYFSNCSFVSKVNGYLVETVSGQMLFFDCQFTSQYEYTVPEGSYVGAIHQNHGRLELHQCRVEAPSAGTLHSGHVASYYTADGAVEYQEGIQDALDVVLEGCLFSVGSYWFRLIAYGRLHVSGRDNEVGSAQMAVGGPELDAKLQWVDGAGRPQVADSEPAMIEGDLQLRAAVGRIAGAVTLSALAATYDIVQIEWNADWVEVRDRGGTVNHIQYILMASSGYDRYDPEIINYPVGATLRLYAVDRFTLRGGGNILMSSAGPLTYPPGAVAQLRFVALHRKWVLL